MSIAFSESSFKAIMDMFSVRSGSIDRLVQNVKVMPSVLAILTRLASNNDLFLFKRAQYYAALDDG